MPDHALDTSVCIDLLRGVAKARQVALDYRRQGRVYLHAAVVAELITGSRSKAETKGIEALIASTVPVCPTEHDVRTSLTFLHRLRPAHGVDWNDCLIAATAIRLGLTVTTLNVKHFRVIRGCMVTKPY